MTSIRFAQTVALVASIVPRLASFRTFCVGSDVVATLINFLFSILIFI